MKSNRVALILWRQTLKYFKSIAVHFLAAHSSRSVTPRDCVKKSLVPLAASFSVLCATVNIPVAPYTKGVGEYPLPRKPAALDNCNSPFVTIGVSILSNRRS